MTLQARTSTCFAAHQQGYPTFAIRLFVVAAATTGLLLAAIVALQLATTGQGGRR